MNVWNHKNYPLSVWQKRQKPLPGKVNIFFILLHSRCRTTFVFFEGYYKYAGLKAGLHIHKTLTEVFTVFEGEFTFHLQEGSEVLRAGDTIIATPFHPHGFSSNLPNSRMQIASIGYKNRENFFIELEKIANGEINVDQDELEAFFNRYDQYNIK